MKKLSYGLHGFLFAAGCAVNLYMASDAVLYNPPSVLALPLLFSVVVFLLFLLIGYVSTRRLEVAGLIASLFILGFFYLWPIFLLVVTSTLVCLLVFRILFKKVKLNHVHMVLNTISIAVVGFYLFQLASLLTGVSRVDDKKILQPIPDLPATSASLSTLPDIYYIILDGYGRADMLQAVHGFDNTEFVAALEQRGFFVGSSSQANYPRTLLSLSSSLNMQYLDSMSSAMGDSRLWWPVRDTVQHSQVRTKLESLGYKTVFFASSWDDTDIQDGDYYETPFKVKLNNFANSFLVFTNLRIFQGIERFGLAWPSYDTHRELIRYGFTQLPAVASIEGPKFVFTHIIAAHPPFVFDRLGNPVNPKYPYSFINPPASGDNEGFRKSYIDQLLFVNREILTMIDGILDHSARPPIIILQGDHGPGITMDLNSIKDSCLFERFSILNAVYLPGFDQDSIPMDLAPVNTFRLIFNHYFQTKLEILPNKQYFSANTDPYQFIEVTAQAQAACK
jgi:hypothetical protein